MATTEQELTRLRHDVEQNTRLNLILLVTLLVITGLTIGFAAWKVRQLTRPENLVSLAEEKIEANYPEVRAALKEQLVEAAPRLAKKLSRTAVRSVPEARAELVQFLGRQLAAGLDEATEWSADEFRAILRENRALVHQGVEELKEFPDRAERFVVNLEKRLEQRWDADVQKQARFVLRAHRAFNDKLERLSANERLDPEDLLARRILRILRAMQVREQRATAAAN